jgi:parvulin-like peptidyl-prolyl isomerase
VWFLISGCAAGRGGLDETVLASVNGEPVTVQDLEQGFESSHQGHTVLLAGSGAVREFLDKSIDRRLLLQEARRIGLDEDAEVRGPVNQLRFQRARDQLYKEEVSQRPEVSEEAIQQAYGKMAVRYRVRHILTYTREDAEKAAARVRGGEAFGAVAAEVSVSDTAGKGGDLGSVAWGQLDPRLESELEAMQPGDIRGPLETEQGWNVLLLEEKGAWKERPELAKLRNRIKMTLSQRALARRSFAYFDELRSRWKVEVFEERLTAENLLPGGKGGPAADQAKQIVVATAGERTISLADLRGQLNLDAVQKAPRGWALQQIRKILDDLLFGLLLEQEALRRGYDQRPTIVREADKLENALLLNRLMGTVVYARIQVTGDEVRAFYEQNPKLFTEPEAVRLGVIAVEAEQDAQAVLQELNAGADFAALARAKSRDPVTARLGGEAGWITRGTANPGIEAVAFSLKAGEVGLAKSEKASFVVKLEERRPERLQEFAAVKEKAREMLLTQRRREEVRRWLAQLRGASEIIVEDAAIGQAVAAFEDQAKQRAAGKSAKGEKKPKDHP